MAELFCNQCGHRNPPSARFCSSCGSPLSGALDDPTTSVHAIDTGVTDTGEEEVAPGLAPGDLPEGSGLLIVKRGPGSGSRFSLDAEKTLAGRHPDSDIFLDDITVSRRHVEIVREGGGYVVRDVGSLNGTYVNRERIEEAPLNDGDELQIGAFKLVFFAGGRRG